MHRTAIGPTSIQNKSYASPPGFDIGFQWSRENLPYNLGAQDIAVISQPDYARIANSADISITSDTLHAQFDERPQIALPFPVQLQMILDVLCTMREKLSKAPKADRPTSANYDRELPWIALDGSDPDEKTSMIV